MNHASRHCPFLNRADERCASYFNLDGFSHAYRYCFDRYKTCPLYVQLLVERRMRRNGAAAEIPREHTYADAPANTAKAPIPLAPAPAPLVQVRISAGARDNPAGVAGLPPSPGV